jgi:hypothetical protein
MDPIKKRMIIKHIISFFFFLLLSKLTFNNLDTIGSSNNVGIRNKNGQRNPIQDNQPSIHKYYNLTNSISICFLHGLEKLA